MVVGHQQKFRIGLPNDNARSAACTFICLRLSKEAHLLYLFIGNRHQRGHGLLYDGRNAQTSPCISCLWPVSACVSCLAQLYSSGSFSRSLLLSGQILYHIIASLKRCAGHHTECYGQSRCLCSFFQHLHNLRLCLFFIYKVDYK